MRLTYTKGFCNIYYLQQSEQGTFTNKKYNNTKCQGKEGHQEYLFYVQKKPIEEVVVESPLNYTGSKSKMVDIIKRHLPTHHLNKLVDAFGGGFNVY